jgi:transcription factor S
MKFCDDCGGLLIAKDGKFVCRNCGKKSKDTVNVKITSKSEQSGIHVFEDNKPDMPVMDRECKKCGCKKAYFWLIQTRSGDEPPTQFFRCIECRHTWREYK